MQLCNLFNASLYDQWVLKGTGIAVICLLVHSSGSFNYMEYENTSVLCIIHALLYLSGTGS